MARTNRPTIWRLAFALFLLLSFAAPMARSSIATAAGLTQTNTERVLCTKPSDAPDLNGRKDKYGRPMTCVSGDSINYLPTDPAPPQLSAVEPQGGGDSRIFTSFFDDAKQVINLGPDWSRELGPVTRVPGTDMIALTLNKAWTRSILQLYHVTEGASGPVWTYATSQEIEGWGTRSIAVGDIDGDDKTDIVVANPDDISSGGNRGNINVFFQDSNTSWTRVVVDLGNTPDALAMPVLNGGKSAIVVQNWNDNSVHILKAPQGPSLSRTLTHDVFPSPTGFAGWDSMAVGDVDGDGLQDDAVSAIGQWVGNNNARLRFFTADNSGVFAELPAMPGGFLPNDVKMAEVTGDPFGRQDILVLDGGNYPTGRLTIYPLGNTKPITQPVSYIMDDIPEDGVMLPVDCKDRLFDFVAESSGWERQSIKLRSPNGIGFTPELYVDEDGVYTNGGREQILAVEDINYDGHLDIIKSADYRGLWYRLHRPCVTITKTAPASVKLGESFEYTITVLNSGQIPTFGMVISDVLPLGLINPIPSSGTVTNGRNYTSAPFDLEPGQSKTVTIRVTTTQFGLLENSAVACSKGACTLPAKATTEVKDVIPFVSFTQTDTYVNEGSPSAVLTVRLSETTSHDVTVNVRLYGGTANTLDVRLSTPVVTIRAGTLESQAVVAIEDDSIVEGEEYTNVQLTGPTGALLAVPAVEKVHILDNDTDGSAPNVVNFTSANYSASLSSNLVTATLVLDRPAVQAMSINVQAYADPNSTTNNIGSTWVGFERGQQTKQFTIDLGADKTPNVTLRISQNNPNIVVLGTLWKATVHRAAVEVTPRLVFLPLVAALFSPIKINDAVARQPVEGYQWLDATKRSYIDKTITVTVPQNGILHISGSANELKPLTYDDALDIYVNGSLLKTVQCTRGNRLYGCDAIDLNLPPSATVVLRFVAYDTERSVIEAFEGWLIP